MPIDLVVRNLPLGQHLTHSVTVRAATLNEETRTVDAVLATAGRIRQLDPETGRIVEAILVLRGGELPDQIPLVDSHPEYERGHLTIADMRGSIRNLRIEGDQLIGRLHFAPDEASLSAFALYREGHAQDVSIGFDAIKMKRIRPGRSAMVDGRTYTAGDIPLLVITRWRPIEGSLVAHGADADAHVRQPPPDSSKGRTMNKRLQQFLQSLGLRSEATDEEALAFRSALGGDQGRIAGVLDKEDPDDATAQFLTRTALEHLGVNPDRPWEPISSPQPPASSPEPPASSPEPSPEMVAVRQQARQEGEQAAMARMEMIRTTIGPDTELCDDDFAQRAFREAWDEARVAREVLTRRRESRTPAVGPAIHSRSREADCTRQSLGAAMMIRESLDPVADHARFIDGCLVRRREGEPTADLEQAADRGYQYRDWSLVDFCREACRLDGITPPNNRGAMIRAAVSGSALTNIFSTSVNAQLLTGYTDAADSTIGWTSEADVPNFQTNERMAMGKFGQLKKLARGNKAPHLDESDSKEEYKIARYAGQFVVDEQDIIDDRLGAINQVSPSDIGSSAAQLRPNLVYAILLANAALSDTGALFNSTAESTAGGHANLLQDALDAPGLEAGLVAIAKHRIRTRPLNVKARFLIVPQDLRFTGAVLLKSATRDHDGTDGVYNPLAYEELVLRMDDRIGAGGVVDPATSTPYAGTATKWFLAGRPGENGAKTIEIGFLRGTGRAPQVRSFVLTQGQFGVGWDINMDIGAKALDYRALQYSDGTA